MTYSAHCDRCGQPDAEWSPRAGVALCPDCAANFQKLLRAGEELKLALQSPIRSWMSHWRGKGLEDRDLEGLIAIATEQLTSAVLAEDDGL